MNSVIDRDFKPVAQKYNLTVAQVSVAVLVSQEGVVALCGARNQEQAKENSKAGEFLIKGKDIEKTRSSVAGLNL
ncbi:MAG: aldo/keto reductase, partial [Actinomycetota bacterium]